MDGVKRRIGEGFGRFTRLTIQYRILVLVISALLLGGVFSNLRHVTFDPSTEGFFHKDDPTLLTYNAFRDQFGRDEQLILAVSPPEVFEGQFLLKLRDYHNALEAEVPLLDDITSLINARLTQGRGEELVVKDLMEDWPETDAQLAALKTYVMNSPTYRNMLVSEDGTLTTLLLTTDAYTSDKAKEADILEGFDEEAGLEQAAEDLKGLDEAEADPNSRRLLTDEENRAIVAAIEKVNERFADSDFRIFFAGSPVVTDFMKREMMSNMRRFLVMGGAMIAVFLFLLFRRVTGVVFPLLIVVSALMATISVTAWVGDPLSLPAMILPSFLLSVGVGGAVHILAIFFHHFDENGDKEAAMVYAMEHSGLPVVMTSLTTAAGLASFLTATVASISFLGLYAALGVLIAMVMTIVMLPALIAVTPIKPKPISQGQRLPVMDRILNGFTQFSVKRAGLILWSTLALSIIAFLGVMQIDFSHDPVRWFPKDSNIRISTNEIDSRLGGSISAEFLVDTGRENGLYEPDTMRRMEAFTDYAEKYQNDSGSFDVSKTFSLADILKEINQALNENRPEAYTIPDNRELIAQEFVLFENSGSDDLSNVVDTQFQVGRVSVRLPWRDVGTLVGGLGHLEQKAEEIFEGVAKVHATGMLVLLAKSFYFMMGSTVISYSIAAGVITVFMILMLGSLRLGLISMIPNLSPILFTLGFMGWAGIHLDMFTLLIGSIALGLAVDDTIHFMHNYAAYRDAGKTTEQSIQSTLHSTGRAMLITTLVLVGGFWVFMFATLNNLFLFGLLTGLTLVLALLADFLIAPALMVVLDKGKGTNQSSRRR